MPEAASLGRRAAGWLRRGVAPAVAAGLAASLLAGCGSSDDAKPGPAASVPAGEAGAPAYTGPSQGPAGDAFYTPATPLPAGRPGDVLRYRTVEAKGALAPLKATVYEILYLSTDTAGKPDVVSGTVVVPAGVDLAAAPVLSYAAGTHGIGDACAPSRGIAAGTDYGLPDIAAAAGRGWVVAATDYQGLGTPGLHTYAVGRAEGHAVIDAARAATRLPGDHPAPGAKVAYWGYSQGGGAAAWAGELTAAYAPDLHVVGIAAGGVPANLAEVSRVLDGSAQVGLQFMAAVGLDAAYPDLRLDSYLTPAGRAGVAALRTGCTDATKALAGRRVTDITTKDPLTTAVWQRRLAENSLGTAPPKVPIYLYHGTRDTTVAYAQGEALMRTYCAKKVTVVWKTFDGNHLGGLGAAGGAIDFLTGRFAGQPVTSTC
jgi:hypothetical protein